MVAQIQCNRNVILSRSKLRRHTMLNELKTQIATQGYFLIVDFFSVTEK